MSEKSFDSLGRRSFVQNDQVNPPQPHDEKLEAAPESRPYDPADSEQPGSAKATAAEQAREQNPNPVPANKEQDKRPESTADDLMRKHKQTK